jgi:hypothetical protein
MGPLKGWKNLDFVFNFTDDLHVRMTGERGSHNLPHQSRPVSNENSDLVHTAPIARKYGETKNVWECSKMVQHAENLDLFKVVRREVAGAQEMQTTER